MPQLTSAKYGVSSAALDATGAFDCFVDIDSALHVDPHLLSVSAAPEMQEAENELKKYFEDVITLLIGADAKVGPIFASAKAKLRFSETKGVSLGHSKAKGDGSAVGQGLATLLADRAFDIVKAGQKDTRIFELVGLFTEDYGADRISDVVLNIAEKQFAKYTARVAKESGIPTSPVVVRGETFSLPIEVVGLTTRHRLLVPKDVLRDLPIALDRRSISAVAAYNQEVRDRVNDLFASVGADAKSPSKQDMWARAKGNPAILAALVAAYNRASGPSYDFLTDPGAELRRFLDAQAIAATVPLALTKPQSGWNGDTAFATTKNICEHFKKLVEHNGLWVSFWYQKGNSKRAVTERAIQRIFLAVALTYLKAGGHDLDISPESSAGHGPVDFKFSHGAAAKVTVEMKRSNNSRLAHGYETQLALYNAAEDTCHSIFLIVRVSDERAQIDAVLAKFAEAKARGERAPMVIVVDGRSQLSASKA